MFLILALVGNVSFEGLGWGMGAVFQMPLRGWKHLGSPWALQQWGSLQLDPHSSMDSSQSHRTLLQEWTCSLIISMIWAVSAWVNSPDSTGKGRGKVFDDTRLLNISENHWTLEMQLKPIIPVSVFCLPCHGVIWCRYEWSWELCALRGCCCWRLSNFCDSGLRA